MKTNNIVFLLCLCFIINLNSQNLSYSLQITNNTSCCDYSGPKVFINQINVSPTNYNGSIYGFYSTTNPGGGEWIELYNPSPCSSIDISNYILGTDSEGPASIIIPTGTIIPPKGFAIVRGINAPIPPSTAIDIIISNLNQVCISNGRFYLVDSGSWLCLYNATGTPVDAIKWAFGYSSTNPCNPPGNSLNPNSTLNSFNQVNASTPVFGLSVPYPLTGKTFYRTIDGGTWNTSNYLIEGSTDLSYGSCNSPANCAPPSSSCNGSVTIIMNSGIAPYSFHWNEFPTNNSSTTSNLCAGQYTCIVTDATNTSQAVQITINEDLFNLNPIISHTSCDQPNGEIQLSPSPLGNYTFSWTPNVSSNNSANNLAAGNYHLSITKDGCEKDTIIEILPSDGINLQIQETPVNCSTNTGLIVATISNGNSPFTFIWNDGSINDSIITGANQNYLLTVTDNNGCTVSDSIHTISPIYPLASANSTSEICVGDNLSLTAQSSNLPNISYNWSGPNNFSSNLQNPTIQNSTNANSGNYVLTVNSNNCISYDTISILLKPLPILNFTSNLEEGCQPLNITFTNNSTPNTASIKWNFGDGNESNENTSIDHIYMNEGSYSIQLIGENNGCIDTLVKSNYILAHPKAKALFHTTQLNATIDAPSFQIINESLDATSYDWSFGDNTHSNLLNPSHTYKPEAGFHEIILIANNQFNCPDTFNLSVEILNPLIFFIPNTFTPDGDQFNQIFKPIFTSGFDEKSYELTIFNRWGEIIFETKDYHIGWDGTINNQISQDGTYTWNLNFKDAYNDNKYHYNGHVNLIK